MEHDQTTTGHQCLNYQEWLCAKQPSQKKMIRLMMEIIYICL